MAQPLQTINLVAPAFKGINTEDSPIAQDPSFADIADNAVIDKRGRIAARKGIEVLTTAFTGAGGGLNRVGGSGGAVQQAAPVGTDYLHKVHFRPGEGAFGDNEAVLSVGNNNFFIGTTSLYNLTTPYTITGDDNFKFVNFNGDVLIFQRNFEPLIWQKTSVEGTTTSLTGYSSWALSGGSVANFYKAHEAIAAFGRLWLADNTDEAQTIYWSDLLNAKDFTGGSSGFINVGQAWPDGTDKIRALAAHNNQLIIFGDHSILVYEGADSPATMSLVDTISGVGCVCRNSVQNTGTDILFMSYDGLRSLGRVIQEKSLPISDYSKNVKTELVEILQGRDSPTSSIYSPENSFYLISFLGDVNVTYCFDVKGTTETGGYRVTRWPTSDFRSFARKTDGTVLIGTYLGIGKYSGYLDNNSTYRFRYYSPALTFGDSSRLKFLKKIQPTIVGGEGTTVALKWAYDFSSSYNTTNFVIADDTNYLGNFNESEYVANTETEALSTNFNESVFYAAAQNLGSFADDATAEAGGGTGAGGVLQDGDWYYNTTTSTYKGWSEQDGPVETWTTLLGSPETAPWVSGLGRGYFSYPRFLGTVASPPIGPSNGDHWIYQEVLFLPGGGSSTTYTPNIRISGSTQTIASLTLDTFSEYTYGNANEKFTTNASGCGSTVSIGVEVDINGHPFSLQEINVLALIGKTQ